MKEYFDDENESYEDNISHKKEPAEPIPEDKYKMFKYKLEEEHEKFSERNLTLFLLGVATGYRTEDIVDLTVGDIREALKNDYFEIQEKKQYKRWHNEKLKNPLYNKKIPSKRKAFIKANLKQLLKQYVRNKKNSEYAFPSNKGISNIKADSYSKILTQIGKDLGIEHISGHSMRKTYANRLWENTHDIEYVRKALGHKSIETTKLYLGFNRRDIESAAETTDSKL